MDEFDKKMDKDRKKDDGEFWDRMNKAKEDAGGVKKMDKDKAKKWMKDEWTDRKKESDDREDFMYKQFEDREEKGYFCKDKAGRDKMDAAYDEELKKKYRGQKEGRKPKADAGT